MQNRPLRPFEQGAHLHVLDWCHDTARYRLQAAGAVQVRAAAKAFTAAAGQGAGSPPPLPSLQAAITAELRKLYALGHATVRSELEHQRSGGRLPVGLSAAPAPPHLRRAKSQQEGKAHNCASCKMYDPSAHVCWGYGNWPVKPNQLCDSYTPDVKAKTLALEDALRDPARLRERGALAAAAAAHEIWQAVHRGRLQGIAQAKRLRAIGRQAGAASLAGAAWHHAGGAINAGRHAAALASHAQIAGARYTSVLDKSSCQPCKDADTGQLLALDDPGLVHPPNPLCLGGDRCRCILVYQLITETDTAPQQIAASR